MKKTTIETKFFDKLLLIPFHACWEFDGYHNRCGYAVIGHRSQTYLAHRVSYTLHKGSISKSFEIDHLCRNRGYVNELDELKPAVLKLLTEMKELTFKSDYMIPDGILYMSPKTMHYLLAVINKLHDSEKKE